MKGGVAVNLLDEEMMKEIFCAFKDGLLSRHGVLIAMKKAIKKGKFYSELLPKPITTKELEEVISETNNELSKIKLLNNDKRKEILLGFVMNKVRIFIEGKIVYSKINH